jgi:hypothetical protein
MVAAGRDDPLAAKVGAMLRRFDSEGAPLGSMIADESGQTVATGPGRDRPTIEHPSGSVRPGGRLQNGHSRVRLPPGTLHINHPGRPMTFNNSTATWPAYDRTAFLGNCKAMVERAERLRAEMDTKVCVFDGTIAEFRAELDRLGMIKPPGPAHPLGFSALDGLEVREFGGKVYAGTRAALKKKLPFLYPLDMPPLGSRDVTPCPHSPPSSPTSSPPT